MKKLFLSLGLLLCSFLLHAQKNYAVKVADSMNENPLANATVLTKATNISVTTNESGTTVIMALPGDIIKVSCAGYVSQEVTLSANAAVPVYLAKVKIKKKKSRS
jgi:hypothetical protein